MNTKLLQVICAVCCVSLLTPVHCIDPIGAAKKSVHLGVGKSMIGFSAAHKAVSAAKGFGVGKSLVLGKKALLLAPIKIPLILGGKALLAAKLAVPMGIGAAIGAPVGALIGAKAGALKGAIIGKAIIGAKLGLAKKAAVGAASLAVKPVIFVTGLKAKAAGAGIGLVGKGVSFVGTGISKIGGHIKEVGSKVGAFNLNIPTFSLPSLPTLPTLPVVETKSKGPTSLEYSFVVNGPHTGYKTKKGTFYSNRRRRSAQPEPLPAPQQGSNVQHLLQLVRSQNAQQCLQRVICELTANPNNYGNEGVRFGRSLILLDSQTDTASAAQYRQAATTGSQVSAEQCIQFYPTCAFQSEEVIRLGNQMINN